MHRSVMLGAIALMMAGTCLAQTPTPTPSKYYKLDFVLREVETGKVLSSHAYSMLAPNSPNSSSIRTGSKIPVPVTGSSSFTYVDVGVSIDCNNLHEVEGGIGVSVSADVSTIPQESLDSHSSGAPTIRQNKWRSEVLIPLRAPTVIFSSDDLTSRRVMLLEVTATPVKVSAH
jgi:hypothetical protein